MKAFILLADNAQAVNGKLYILGGGWSATSAIPPSPMAIVILVKVPWGETNKKHICNLSLEDADGGPVLVPTPMGDQPLVLKAEFEVGRPAGIPPGFDLDVPIAVNLQPIPSIKPAAIYVWKLAIDGQTDDQWRATFYTRPAPV